MLAQSSFVLFFCELSIVCADAWLCMNYTDIIKEDTYMNLRMFRKVKLPSVYDCAARCLMSSVCASFNFDLVTRTCHLNSERSTDVEVVSRRGFVFSDIHHWPKSLTGPCSTVSCPNTSACIVDRMGVAWCETEFQGCGTPPLPPGTSVTYDGHYLHAVATYKCAEDYKPCHNNLTSMCRSSGQWHDVSGLCGQYRWNNLTAAHTWIPCGPVSEMQLTLVGTPTSTRVNFILDILGERLDNGEIFLHVRRYSHYTIVAYRTLGKWVRTTVRPGLFGANHNLKLVVTFKNEQYTVEVNGTELATVRHPNRGELPAVIGFYNYVGKHELLILT